jgi:hypothetical protein
MGITESKLKLCEYIKNEDIENAKKILEENPEFLTEPLNQGRDTPGLILACTYGSNKILKLFLDVKKFFDKKYHIIKPFKFR